jgi:hypothetical protein
MVKKVLLEFIRGVYGLGMISMGKKRHTEKRRLLMSIVTILYNLSLYNHPLL